MLTKDVRDYAERSVLCWLATVGRDNTPNVSPKEIFTIEGDSRFLIANIASPMTIRNIRHHPEVCVSFVEVFVQKGYKLKGRADLILPTHSEFSERARPLQTLAGELSVRSVIAIDVREVTPIIAPRYRFDPETQESAQIENAMQTYSVRPIEDLWDSAPKPATP